VNEDKMGSPYKLRTIMSLALAPFFVLELFIKNKQLHGRKDTWYFLMHEHDHLGDMYRQFTLMQAFKDTWGEGRIAVLVKDRYVSVAKLFPAIDEAIPYNQSKYFPAYIIAVMYSVTEKGVLLNGCPGVLNYDVNRFQSKSYKSLNTISVYEFGKGVPIDSLISLPVIGSEMKTKGLKLFKELNLKPHTTVVLFPYAHDEKFEHRKFWALLTQKLRKRGYKVLVNSRDPILEDTETSYLPLDAIIPFVEKAGWIIAARTGMMDLISSAKCNMTILYPNKDLFLRDSLKYYRYPNMHAINELVVEEFEGHEDEIVDHILKTKPKH
jgi:hypothetical protein